MLDTLWHLAQQNEFLAAGIGTMAFGSLIYFVRSLPRWAWNTALRFLTTELTLHSQSALYHELLAVLTARRLTAIATNFTTSIEGTLGAGYGDSLATHAGHLVHFKRQLSEDKAYGRFQEKLHVRLFTRRISAVRSLIEEAAAPQDESAVKVYPSSSMGGYWMAPVRKRRRHLDTIYTDAGQKEEIIARINDFLAKEEWYARCGIPYKLVFLLHGPPGTGKTSLIFGIASHFGRSLCNVTSIGSVDELLRQTPANSLVHHYRLDTTHTISGS